MHQHMLKRIAGTIALSLVVSTVAFAQPPDNSKVNKRDRAKDAPTADQQKENATDRTLAQKIRRSLVQDKSLSTYAHNVKVIAMGGNVTLKGPVHSEEERKTVEAKAVEVAGTGHVSNEMSVAPAKSSRK